MRRAAMAAPRSLAVLAMFLFIGVALSPRARAEGSVDIGEEQGLQRSTVLRVDIVNLANETFEWNGRGTVDVLNPDGSALGTYSPGETINPTMAGAYRVTMEQDQFDGDGTGVTQTYPWDITVYAGDQAVSGRLWSNRWSFNSGSFGEALALNTSLYALVAHGGAVVELQMNGLAGFVYTLFFNSVGPTDPDTGLNPGRSVWLGENGSFSIPPGLWPVYINVPAVASYDLQPPVVTAASHSGGIDTCNTITAGHGGTFEFESSTEGTYQLICDLNADGSFDITDDGDLLLLGRVDAGTNTVSWDGLDNDGNPLDPADYGVPLTPDTLDNPPTLHCKIRVTAGEFHYVAIDIETVYPGMRIFNVGQDGVRAPLSALWNDTVVQGSATTMPNGLFGGISSGPGVSPGAYADAVAPYSTATRLELSGSGNARAWGNFYADASAAGKGDQAQLDTFAWIFDDESEPLDLIVVDPTTDSDGDGLADYTELCETGSEFTNPDTDGDGVVDSVETHDGTPGIDTDGDGIDDVLDTDDDGDGVASSDEVSDPNTDPRLEDSDGDTIPDYLDPDDDGDGVSSHDEDLDGDGDPRNDDSDGDGTPNYLDNDDDNDGLSSVAEDVNGDGDPTNDDTDGDGTANFLDPDDNDGPLGDGDGDGVINQDDNCALVSNPDQEDLNDNGVGDACDDDTDGDGVANDTDNCPAIANPDQEDIDADQLGDVCDDDRDGDDVDNVTDNCPDLDNPGQEDQDGDAIGDACDDDPDGDAVPTTLEDIDGDGDPTNDDSDGDGVADYLDPDDDGDGTGTRQEDTNQDGDPTNDDSDSDGIANYLDPDDNDGPTGDVDGDGFTNQDDNCSEIANTDQFDHDSDGLGDVCDDDIDGDGVANGEDDCPERVGSADNQGCPSSYGSPEASGCACSQSPDAPANSVWLILGITALFVLKRR